MSRRSLILSGLQMRAGTKLLCVVSSLFAGAVAAAAPPTCAFRQESLPDPVLAQGAEDQSRVTLLAVQPSDDEKVRSDTVVTVDVEYHVADFQPRMHALSAQFLTVTTGTVGAEDSQRSDRLRSATGRVRLCLSLQRLYENEAIRWPLTFSITLHELGRNSSRILASSESRTLYSSDAPAAALARQTSMPSPAYQAALLSVFGFFEVHAALEEACEERFPDLAPTLKQEYARWREPHAALIERVSDEQRRMYLLLMFGSEEHADRAHGAAREANMANHRKAPDFALRKQCDAFLRSLVTPQMDPEARLAAPLRILRDPVQRNPTDAT